jgi:hypothetical protein
MRRQISAGARRQSIATTIDPEILVRPGRQTPRKPAWVLAELKYLEQFNWTEDGVPIGRSEEDLLDVAYEKGVRAGFAAALAQYRRPKKQVMTKARKKGETMKSDR